MLREPEASIVRAYLSNGGEVKRVPFGISGHVYGFQEESAVLGRRGWAVRFGVRHIPLDVLPFVMAGVVSVPIARADLVWELVHANDGRATIAALAKALGLSGPCIGVVLEFLESIEAVVRQQCRPARFVAIGKAPDWRRYIKGERRAA